MKALSGMGARKLYVKKEGYWELKGEVHPRPKLGMFCALSQNDDVEYF